ncbi:trypsin-like serine peptidase [Actinoallomurus acaciae]|uniref:Trypsin-like serine peptidase n=1 Tax=Actinoallomurus acaciae TaxID=502577 RepID=A0ABV5YC07_9ACTN
MKVLLCGVLTAVPLLSYVPEASARVVTSADRGSAAVAYWTPQRMARATPLGARGARSGSAMEVPVARSVAGSRVIGALFFNSGSGGHYCTASVVRTPKRNMLLTAAHCLYSQSAHTWHRHIVFVPRYAAGRRPYGTWPVWLMVADKRWLQRGDPDLDFAFAAVQVMGGHRIADVVGANTLEINQGPGIRVVIAGYPAKENYPADRPVGCAGRAYRQSRTQMRFDCHGFYGGTSGSPWLSDYDARTQTGHVVGVIGGYQEGGSEEWRSYSPIFTAETARLLNTADERA